MNRRVAVALLAAAALGLVGYGAWLMYRPLGPLSVGLLLWLDLTLHGMRRGKVK